MVPAQAILEQFELAKQDCKDPTLLAAWVPMLTQYGPDLLVQCQHVSVLSRQLVHEWLARYMFKSCANAEQIADGIATWLSTHAEFRMHGRHISRAQLAERGLNIKHLEDDPIQQDNILSIFHAVTHTFTQTGAAKIIENHKGNAMIEQLQFVQVGQAPKAVAAPEQTVIPEDIFKRLDQPKMPDAPFKKKENPFRRK